MSRMSFWSTLATIAAVSFLFTIESQAQILISDTFDTSDTGGVTGNGGLGVNPGFFDADLATRQSGTFASLKMHPSNFTAGGADATGSITNNAFQLEGANGQGPRITFGANPGPDPNGASGGPRDFYPDLTGQRYAVSAELSVTSVLGTTGSGGTQNSRAAMTWGYRLNDFTDAAAYAAFNAATLRLALEEQGVYKLQAGGSGANLVVNDPDPNDPNTSAGSNGSVADATVFNSFRLIVDESADDPNTLDRTEVSFELEVNGKLAKVGTVEFLGIETLTLNSDFNLDTFVDAADVGIWESNYGNSLALPADGDANNDGRVDGQDFFWVQRQYGGIGGPTQRFLGLEAGKGAVGDEFTVRFDNPTIELLPAPSVSVVPEPSTICLTLVGLGAGALRRRRRRSC